MLYQKQHILKQDNVEYYYEKLGKKEPENIPG